MARKGPADMGIHMLWVYLAGQLAPVGHTKNISNSMQASLRKQADTCTGRPVGETPSSQPNGTPKVRPADITAYVEGGNL